MIRYSNNVIVRQVVLDANGILFVLVNPHYTPDKLLGFTGNTQTTGRGLTVKITGSAVFLYVTAQKYNENPRSDAGQP